jgi:hypothetical protein
MALYYGYMMALMIAAAMTKKIKARIRAKQMLPLRRRCASRAVISSLTAALVLTAEDSIFASILSTKSYLMLEPFLITD